jgi:hypothetical protein
VPGTVDLARIQALEIGGALFDRPLSLRLDHQAFVVVAELRRCVSMCRRAGRPTRPVPFARVGRRTSNTVPDDRM